MNIKYILNDKGEPVPERNVLTWGRWLKENRSARRVGEDDVGDLLISTLFLGLDHNYDTEGPPILWETMVFDNGGDYIFQKRCAGSRERAEAQHLRIVQLVKEGKLKP